MTEKLDDIFIDTVKDDSTEIIPIISEGDDSFEFKEDEWDNMPVLALRNMVLFPGVVLPVSLGRKKSLLAVKSAYKNSLPIAVFTQIDSKEEDPAFDRLYSIGTIAYVLKMLELPDGTTTAILQGRKRAKVKSVDSFTPYLKASIAVVEDVDPARVEQREFNALLEAIKESAIKIVKSSGTMPQEATFAIKNIDKASSLINFISANFNIALKDKQNLLEIDEIKDRGYTLFGLLGKELQMLEIKLSIQSKTQEGIDQQQREYYLQQQIKTIQDELGDNQSKEIEEFRNKAKKKKWSKEVGEIFEKELSKLERTSPHSADYGVQLNYVETILSLPWNEYSKDSLSLKQAQKILDREHFGLEKVKERILEHLAVLKLKNDLKSPIICLYGPPGVGKTSLGKSVAEALKRKYVRISLGGLSDESEIRGHRRTYIGAMPGRIILSLQKAGTSNPVFILDEIDKLGSDHRGDPSAALLEVLDPEQNSSFHDNFLDIDYDLSKVLFIATANSIGSIPQPLLDRMELIEVSGYLHEEKLDIASKHLIPKELGNHGLKADDVEITRGAVSKIIENYTRESGVRELDKLICKVLRKVALQVASMKEKEKNKITIAEDNLKDFLGTVRYTRESYEGNEYAGVVTGLAWTAVGGEILYVETSLSKSKAPKLTLTGNLGDVMKESAVLALEYLRAHAEKLDIDPEMFEQYNVHVHVPEGAIPKDGPSAGVTMATSICSAFTKRKVRKNLAMTGEITLRGKVLPVGGIKEKILAAKRANIKEIVLCSENRRDIDEIKEVYVKGLKFHYVEDIMQVLDYALLNEKVTD